MSGLVNAGNNFMSRLADNLSSSDNTLTVVDDYTKLPEPPFLLTINNGKENMEIVKVGLILPDDRLAIERAQEGTTAQSHEAGSLVENNFTAGTYQALVSEIQSLSQQLETAVFVEEQGENSNGSYIRYSNGIQEIWSQIELTYNQSSNLRAQWNFPKSFRDRNYSLSVTLADSSGSFPNVTKGEISHLGTTDSFSSSMAYLYMFKIDGIDNFTNEDRALVMAYAIGRWK